MKLSELLRKENIDVFSSVPLSACRVIKPYLLKGAEGEIEKLQAVMMILPYPHGEAVENSASRGRVAPKFAAFSKIFDYHLFFEELSEKVKAYFSDKYPGVWVKVFADHSPIDERRAAVTAGLGVMGDNGLFISEKYGSFVFLGEIVCSLTEEVLEGEGIPSAPLSAGELEGGGIPSAPLSAGALEGGKMPAAPLSEGLPGCLHCGKCAEICPAGCIGEGKDKALCVSNLTQKKGELSEAEREIIKKSGYVWGCDRCADVCPMNKNKDKPRYSEFFTAAPFEVKGYEDIEAMSPTMYQKYPFSWRKIEVMRRNYEIFSEKTEINSEKQ